MNRSRRTISLLLLFLIWVAPLTAQTPAPVASPAPKTVDELRTRIQQILAKPELAPAMVGVKVVSLDSGRVLFEENAAKLLRPASNMKLYTVATALDRLTPDYRFLTSVYASKPDSQGVIHGDVRIYGRGDPSFAARFNNGDYFKAIDELAARIVAAGVKRVEGDLVGDETHFIGPKYGAGWEWEDLTWYYGAEVTPLSVNDNALDLFVKPGPAVGQPAVITTGPPDPLLTIVNRVMTGPKGLKRDLSVHRGLNENTITITGTIPFEDKGYTGGIGISHPALLFIYMLRSSLAQKGVTIAGKSRVSGAVITPGEAMLRRVNWPQDEIAAIQSPPLSVIAAQTMKPSQNLYTELLLRTLGTLPPPPPQPPAPSPTPFVVGPVSEQGGLEFVRAFLRTAGIRPESLVLDDGSGLSRSDMITAEATVQLLQFMDKHRYAAAFRDALPIAGVDGTLRTRLRGTPAEKNLRAKTGSLSSAASLAGYVTTAGGEKLAFAIMVNNYPRDFDPRSACIDPIAVLLASFTAKPEVSNSKPESKDVP